MTVFAEAIVLQRAVSGQRAGLSDAVNGDLSGPSRAQFRSQGPQCAIRMEVLDGWVLSDALLAEKGLQPATPFQSASWLSAWQTKIGEVSGVRPVIAIGYAGGDAVFALPLAVVRKFGVRMLVWHGSQLNDYCTPVTGNSYRALISSVDGAHVMASVAETVGDIDLVMLTKTPLQAEGLANPFVLPSALPYHARAHAISLPVGMNFEQFYSARRSTKTRRRIKEKLNALERLGPVEFRFAASASEARMVSRLCLAAKSRQLQANGHWDPFSDPAVRNYVESSFADEIGRSTWACSLRCGGEILATAIGFRDARSWLLYQMSMEDSGKERHSPGTHLLMNLLRQCIAEGAEELDLGLGDESYKAEWCDRDKDLALSTLAFTPKGRMLEQFIRARARILSRLSADPALHAKAKRLQNTARKLRIPV